MLIGLVIFRLQMICFEDDDDNSDFSDPAAFKDWTFFFFPLEQLFYLPPGHNNRTRFALDFTSRRQLAMTAHNDTGALLWKPSVSDLLCSCEPHMSPRISRFIHWLSTLFFTHTRTPWKHFVSKGMYDCGSFKFPCLNVPCTLFNVIVWKHKTCRTCMCWGFFWHVFWLEALF